MKIVLNIKELLEEGQIDQTEYDKLLLLSKRQTTSLAFNLLLGIGIVATSIGAIALAPSPYSCFIFGLALTSAINKVCPLLITTFPLLNS